MFGHHDANTQDDQAMMPTDDSMLASLPMPDNNEPMIIESNDDTGADTSVMPSSFRQSSPTMDDAPGATAPAMPVASATADDLIGIKQEALQHLKPLVGHLEQTPEEKFRTTMMMIQAADDQSLIPDAFAAAKSMTDDKARAQALLDVVNEINYFTSQQTPTTTA